MKDDVAKAGQGPGVLRAQRGGSALLSVFFAGAVVAAGGAALGREVPVQERPPVLLSPAGEPFRAGPETPDPLAAWFSGADADHDGRITLTEFVADSMRFFSVVDRNGDGRIDRSENDRYERELVPELNTGPQPASGPPRILGNGAPPKRPASLTGEQQPIRAADTDINQVVTQAEFRALTDRRFVALNLVRDTALTRDELPEATALAAPGQRRPLRGRPDSGARLRDPNTRSEAGVGY